jgi:hypothetical protein
LARYREKDSTDLAWNSIRRQITRDIDTVIMTKREAVLNVALSAAWDRFTKAIESGEVVQVEGTYTELVDQIVADVVPTDES